MVTLPGDGGYQLAVRLDHAAALAEWRASSASAAGDAPPHIMVGRRAQAMALTPEWSKQTSLVTDRMWDRIMMKGLKA